MGDEPHILGHAGLTGRQPVVRIPDGDEVSEDPVEPSVWRAAQVMPANCMRVFQSPRSETCQDVGGVGFGGDCVGFQQDTGTCLLEIVRRAQELGVAWSFDVYSDEWGNQSWRYAGPPLA